LRCRNCSHHEYGFVTKARKQASGHLLASFSVINVELNYNWAQSQYC
jgi:hypothetical protein